MSLNTTAQYSLPGDPEKDIYIVATSGGADSSAVCVLLKNLFPTQRFIFCFTDTGYESHELYEHLDSLETFLGQSIVRIKSDKGTFEDILNQNGNFLPSSKARWCTRELKIVPYKKWTGTLLKDLPAGTQVHGFVGLRADEEQRSGFEHKVIQTHYPLRELGMDKQAVFSLLADTIGVPTFYRYRSRSGCKACPFMRKSEFLGLLQHHRADFDHAATREVIDDQDIIKFTQTVRSVAREIGWGANWTTLPYPSSISTLSQSDRCLIEEMSSCRSKTGRVTLWFGAEFMVSDTMSIFAPDSPGIYWQQPVTFSSSRAGLVRQLNLHAKHRLETAGAQVQNKEEIRSELHYVIYGLEFSEEDICLTAPGNKSYTWMGDMSLGQLKHTFSHILRTLHTVELKRQLSELEIVEVGSWEEEYKESLAAALVQINPDVSSGQLFSISEFRPNCFTETPETQDLFAV
jgi:hypothetical protein